jgi:hypothetical protein
MNSKRYGKFILELSLFAVVLIQTAIVVFKLVLPLRAEVQTVADRSAFERSARLSFGDRFYEYLDFIRDEVPDEGTVVLPPVSIDATFGNMGIMQYFLAPREVVNCPTEQEARKCLSLFDGKNTYFLHLQGFPTASDESGGRELIPLDDSLGLLSPPA